MIHHVIAGINQKEITIRGKDRPRTVITGPDWGRIDDGAWRLRPPGIGIKKPLQIGKEWKSDSNGIHLQSGLTFRATTPAGTFDTFRIDITIRLINTKDQTKLQTWTFVIWYAEAVNRWVKKKSQWRAEGRVRDSFYEELTAYSRGPTHQ
jgi:hypothetical protein